LNIAPYKKKQEVHSMSADINKEELMANMAENLMVLRTKLRLKQSELAGKVGVSRQTLLEIEKRKRPMSWNTFVALLTVFREDKGTDDLLEHFGIYSIELSKFLTSPEIINSD
jgi:DNA-binding XRE family transcriptional regulator